MRLPVAIAAIALAGTITGAVAKEHKHCHCAATDAKSAANASPVAVPDLRGTKTAPVAVDVMALPDPTDEEKSQRAEDRHESRLLVWFTGALAVGTVALGMATLLLWRATRRLVLDAMENAERQLRAYVSVESSSISYEQGRPAQAGVTLKNYGNTPAYELTINSGMGMAASFDELPTPVTEPIGEPRGVLSPGATAVLVRDGPVPLQYFHLTSLAEGKLTVFVYGEVRYVDVFKKPRVLKFRLMTGGSVGLRGNALVSCEKGNDAD